MDNVSFWAFLRGGWRQAHPLKFESGKPGGVVHWCMPDAFYIKDRVLCGHVYHWKKKDSFLSGYRGWNYTKWKIPARNSKVRKCKKCLRRMKKLGLFIDRAIGE